MIYVSVKIPVELTEEDGCVIAISPMLNVGSQGETRVDALKNVKEALDLYFEED